MQWRNITLGNDLAGFINLIIAMAECGQDNEVLACVDNFGKLRPTASDSMLTCGSCDGIAKQYEDNPSLDISVSGLAGSIRTWVISV